MGIYWVTSYTLPSIIIQQFEEVLWVATWLVVRVVEVCWVGVGWGVGGGLFIVIVMLALWELLALSVAVAFRVCCPLLKPVEFNDTL